MDRRLMWIVVVVLLVVGGVWWVRKGVDKNAEDLLDLGNGKVVVPSGMEKDFEDAGLVVSDEADKANLEDVAGGDSRGAASLEKEEKNYIHYVVADLPEPGEGFYEGWLLNSVGDVLYTGKLEMKKGGWVLEYRTEEDLSDYKRVIVTLETVDDQKPEKHVLEGNL